MTGLANYYHINLVNLFVKPKASLHRRTPEVCEETSPIFRVNEAGNEQDSPKLLDLGNALKK